MSHYIFYKIVCEDCPDYIYIGSTKSYRSRKNQHKNACNNENYKNHNSKIYKTLRDNGGWENWNMIIIDEGKELTFIQARIKEEELRLKYNGNLNSYKAYRTEEEKKQYDKDYYENNKDILKEKKREYDLNNKEKRKEYNEKNKEKIKEYNEKNKDILKEKRKEYNENNKEEKKQYYQNNKEKIKEQTKEYRENNKEKIKEYRENNKEYIKEYNKQRHLKKKEEALIKE